MSICSTKRGLVARRNTEDCEAADPRQRAIRGRSRAVCQEPDKPSVARKWVGEAAGIFGCHTAQSSTVPGKRDLAFDTDLIVVNSRHSDRPWPRRLTRRFPPVRACGYPQASATRGLRRRDSHAATASCSRSTSPAASSYFLASSKIAARSWAPRRVDMIAEALARGRPFASSLSSHMS